MSAEPMTPGKLGFRVPAEWEPHAATWMAWPHSHATWGGHTRSVQATYARMASILAHDEDVCILVPSAEVRATAESVIAREGEPSPRIRFHIIPTQTEWIRDYGPIFVNREDRQAILDFGFNSWGARGETWALDDEVPVRMGEILDMEVIQSDLILEGGAISTNGEGLVLTTEACLLRGNRNPELCRGEKERHLREFLGATSILWLGDGIAGRETDGHVCDIARFVNPHTVLAAVEDDRADENSLPLRENMARLMRMYDQHGGRLQVVTMPMPPCLLNGDGSRLPATYLGYYVGNGSVLVPQFGCPTDEVALRTLSALFHTRRAVPIDARELILGGGACHGLLLEQPAPSAPQP